MKMNRNDQEKLEKVKELLWQIMYEHGAHLKLVTEISNDELAIFEAIEKVEKILPPFDL